MRRSRQPWCCRVHQTHVTTYSLLHTRLTEVNTRGGGTTTEDKDVTTDRWVTWTKKIKEKNVLTDVLETDGARRVVEVHTADVQRVELGDVVPSYLHKEQHTGSEFVCDGSEFVKPVMQIGVCLSVCKLLTTSCKISQLMSTCCKESRTQMWVKGFKSWCTNETVNKSLKIKAKVNLNSKPQRFSQKLKKQPTGNKTVQFDTTFPAEKLQRRWMYRRRERLSFF